MTHGPVRAGFLTAFIAALPLAAAFADGLAVDASTYSPSSPRQWELSGTVTEPGPAGGLDIVLASGPAATDEFDDLRLGFDGSAPADGASRWTVAPEGGWETAPASLARFGTGAATFRAPLNKLVLQPVSSQLFTPGWPSGDFSIEFWLKPVKAESGEIVLLWKSTRKAGSAWLSQQMSCLVLRNRLSFGFINFFADPSGKATNFSMQGASVLVPGRWTHHLLRFDSATGLLEYLMDGRPEAVLYATSTGRQGGTVFPFQAGTGGKLDIGPNYSGLMDELRVRTAWVEKPFLARYAPSGGVAISPIWDLGSTNSTLTSIGATVRAPGEAAVQWSYRLGDSSAGWRADSPAWLPFVPGQPLSAPGGGPALGRYVQVRMELFPDAAGEKGPAVSGIRFEYRPDLPPAPPARLSAVAGDGTVTLRWPPSSEADVRGYMVYYGYASGEYFGEDALEGSSPVMVPGAGVSGLTLSGLRNGALCFVVVAAYDGADPPHVGEFSREVSARPSRIHP